MVLVIIQVKKNLTTGLVDFFIDMIYSNKALNGKEMPVWLR